MVYNTFIIIFKIFSCPLLLISSKYINSSMRLNLKSFNKKSFGNHLEGSITLVTYSLTINLKK